MQNSNSEPTRVATETDPPWTSIREHTVRLEPPDVLVFRARGDITIADVEAFYEYSRDLPRPTGGFLYLSNLTHLQHQSQQAAARARLFPEGFIRESCVVGAAFRHRVLIEMMLRTARVFGIKLPTKMPHFVNTENEARAYFAKLRQMPI